MKAGLKHQVGTNSSRFFKSLSLVSLTILVFCLQLMLALPAYAASPVGVLKSGRNAAVYQDQHIGTFEDDFKVFKSAIDGANVRFDELSDGDIEAGQTKLAGYKLIVVPLLVDLPQSEVTDRKSVV